MITEYVQVVLRNVWAHLPPNPTIHDQQVRVLMNEYSLDETQMAYVLQNPPQPPRR